MSDNNSPGPPYVRLDRGRGGYVVTLGAWYGGTGDDDPPTSHMDDAEALALAWRVLADLGQDASAPATSQEEP